MSRLSKRVVEAAEVRSNDYFVWDADLPNFGLRVFASGRRSYLVQYRADGRTRRVTIGMHGVWTAELARKEALSLLGRVASGENPAEERELNHKAITVKQLCERYLDDLGNGLILGRANRPKRTSTKVTDGGRINRHIIPLIGTRRVKDLKQADVTKMMKDIIVGKTSIRAKTKKLRGTSIVRGGAGTAARTVGLLGGILTYAKELGIIETNPAHGVKRPKDNVRTRRLTEAEYRLMGQILRNVSASTDMDLATTADIIRQIALTGCRRGEIISLQWIEADTETSCLRLIETKTGGSIRPIGLPVIEFLDARRPAEPGIYVFPGLRNSDGPFGAFPKHWKKIFAGTPLGDLTSHVLRHSFASIANDLGFTELTIAALVGHAKGSITSRYVHHIDTALVMAADTVSGYIQGLLDGMEYKRSAYAFDRVSRKAALERFLTEAANDAALPIVEEAKRAA